MTKPCPDLWHLLATVVLDASSNSRVVAVSTTPQQVASPTGSIEARKVLTRETTFATCAAHYSETITAGTLTVRAYVLVRGAISEPKGKAGDVVVFTREDSNLAPPGGKVSGTLEPVGGGLPDEIDGGTY